MRISRIEAFGGSCPAVNPSIYICPPFGPAEGPASACSSDCSSSGSSERASRSFPCITIAFALFAGFTSTCAVVEFTTTFSCCTSISSGMFTLSVCPAAIIIPLFVNMANPCATAFTSYFPGARSLNSYTPSLFVVVSIAAPDGVVSSTVAPTTAPPEGSVTCPRSAPVGVCAPNTSANTPARRHAIPSLGLASRHLLGFILLSRSCFLFFDGSCTSRRSRVTPASATTQTPWRKDRRRLPLRRSLQNGLYPTQQRNHGRLRITFARGGHNHHGISFLKITQRSRRQPVQHLLQVSASTTSGASSRPSRRPLAGPGRCRCARLARGRRCSASLAYVRRSPLQPRGDALRYRLRQLADLGIGGQPHFHRLLCRQVRHIHRPGLCVHCQNRPRNIAKRSAHDLVRGELFAIRAAHPSGAQLISHFHRRQRTDLRIVKFHRIRRVPSYHRRLRRTDRHFLAPCRAHYADGHGSVCRVHGLHQATNPVPLPFLFLVRRLLRQLLFLHCHNCRGRERLPVIVHLSTHQDPVASLQIAQLNRRRILQVL